MNDPYDVAVVGAGVFGAHQAAEPRYEEWELRLRRNLEQ